MNIFFGDKGYDYLLKIVDKYDKIFVLTDDKIYGLYASMFGTLLPSKSVLKIILPNGEQNKNIENVCHIWNFLIENNAGKDSLLINIGGGTISDIGGFAASCYKRGIDFVNVPTTLLAMTDASIGGKNAINFNAYKNQIGLFSEPKSIIININFLKTLQKRDIVSGLAEMMKYAFVSDASFLNMNLSNYQDFIEDAARIKEDVVKMDFDEKGLRKILNFGHTIGHAIESFFMDKENSLTHGESVALGMYSALYLSVKYCGLDMKYLNFYEEWFKNNINTLNLNGFDLDGVYNFIAHDKKNKYGKPRFVLISAPEKPVIDVEVTEEDVKSSILILFNLLP